MLKQVYKIDGSGYIEEIHVAKFDEEGKCTEELAEDIITIDPPQGLYKAKWTGVEWIEDMTQEEIEAINNQPRELTDIEKLQIRQSAIEDAINFILEL